jgi:hypothetical protein
MPHLIKFHPGKAHITLTTQTVSLYPITKGGEFDVMLSTELFLTNTALLPLLNQIKHIQSSAIIRHNLFARKTTPTLNPRQYGFVGWIRHTDGNNQV